MDEVFKVCKTEGRKNTKYFGCNKLKNINDFSKRNKNLCKECVTYLNTKYKQDHKEDIAKKKKEYNLIHKKELKISGKAYRERTRVERTAYKKRYNSLNRDKVNAARREYRAKNKEKWEAYEKVYNKKYREDNLEKLKLKEKEYREKNKDKINEKQRIARQTKYKEANEYHKQKIKEDPSLKLRDHISAAIRSALKRNDSSKNNSSCLNYLPFTIKELRLHVENHFKQPGNEWMNWDNNKRFIKSLWKDDDKTTWVWHLDHIIPQSKLIYKTMQDDNFKKCWSLDNLRPYSGKQNILDSNRR